MRDGKTETLTGEALTRWKYQRYMQDYLAACSRVDDNVGRLLDYLDAIGLRENTIVIYTSDQGFFLGDHGLYDKRFMYEESLRMPFLVRWPAAIKPGDAQRRDGAQRRFRADVPGRRRRCQCPPTCRAAACVPLLHGRTPADWRTSMYYRYYHDPGDHNTRAHYGVRTATHKLIYFWKKDQWELFDLVNDPHELHNLYGEPGQEELTATLKSELARLKQSFDERSVRERSVAERRRRPGGEAAGEVTQAQTCLRRAPHQSPGDAIVAFPGRARSGR